MESTTVKAEADRTGCRFGKRLFDAAAAIVALLVLSPFLLVIAVLVRFSSPGPVLFKQARVGLGGRVFKLVKFRTMRAGAENRGPQVTAQGDERVTRVGLFLRRTKLDELPELWNVVAGDLSLVGPRPEVPRYIEHYPPEWGRVFSVKPGITDLATLRFRDEERMLSVATDAERAYIDVVLPVKVSLALEYVERQSPWLDLKILMLTLWGITCGRQSRAGRELMRRIAGQIQALNSNGL